MGASTYRLHLFDAVKCLNIDLAGGCLRGHLRRTAVRPAGHGACLPVTGKRLVRPLQLPRDVLQRLGAVQEAHQVIPQLRQVVPATPSQFISPPNSNEDVQAD